MGSISATQSTKQEIRIGKDKILGVFGVNAENVESVRFDPSSDQFIATLHPALQNIVIEYEDVDLIDP